MDINVLDKNFNRIAIVDYYQSLIWSKRYFDVGSIDLQLEATTENLQTFSIGNYITRDDDETIFVVTEIELDTQANHDNSLIVIGVDCKEFLNRRVIWNQTVFSGTVENYIRKLITDAIINPTINARKINNFYLGTAKNYDDTITQQISYELLGNKIIDLCKTYFYGCKVSFIDGNFYFDLYKGLDRSATQNQNSPIIFSPEYDNLVSSVFTSNETDLKNVALVGGEGEGTNRKLKSVGDVSGINRKEIFVDASSTSTTDGDTVIPNNVYLQQLETLGKDEISKTLATKSFEGEVVTENYIYKTDYNLGDIVTLRNEYGISVDARIIEIAEVWNESGYTILPTFEYEDAQDNFILTENRFILATENGERMQLDYRS